MKKLLAIAFIGGLIMASCTKKETENESNMMVTEPDAMDTMVTDTVMADSAAVVMPMTTDSATTN